MTRRLLLFGLLPVLLLLGAACSGGDDDDGDDGGGETPAATSAPTDAPSEPTTAPTDAPSEPTTAPTDEPTEEPAEAGLLSVLNGVSCSGDWTNLTFGSTGSFDAVFAANEAGDAGTATITLGGSVFGAQGGTVELPIAIEGGNVVVSAAADFLGNANLKFDSEGNAVEAVFEAPPAFLNDASKASLENFQFDGSSLSMMIAIDFGDGRTAESEITSNCA